MKEILILIIFILFFIDYYHKQYRIKNSQKKISYRNSHSVYDDTDYTKYKPYREVYTFKIIIIFLFAILLIEIFINTDNLNIINIFKYGLLNL